ncbi:hypothetical protein B0H67DRAFT_483728, partial [Lasiosphaeris hirsuta]
ALSRGCKMEPLFYGWIPLQCHYDSLTAQWPVFEDRPWNTDSNLTQQISVEQLMAGRHVSIWTRRFHTEHCLFMWAKLSTAVHERREWVDNKTLSYYHAKHCMGQLVEDDEGWQASSNAELGTYKCVRMNWRR